MPGRLLEEPVTADEWHQFTYIKWDDLFKTETAFQTSLPLPSSAPDQRRQNVESEKADAQLIRDVRGLDEQPMLDTHGFQYFKHESSLTQEQFHDPLAIQKLYLPEFVKFLQDHVEGADHITVFDWRLRNSAIQPGTGKLQDYGDKLKRQAPAPIVHIDYTDAGTLRRLERHLSKDCWKLLRGRLRIINMWRPLGGPVRDTSIAFCDGRTYDPVDIVPMDTIRPGFVSQAGAVQYRPGMEWYYRSRQGCDEPVVFKNFDSDRSVTGFTPHAPFKHSPIPENAEVRESIEVRALVFTCLDGKKSVRYDVKEDE